jgi:hypothetical protein
MPSPPRDFAIHVDSSCVSGQTDSEIISPAERVSSNQTTIHHEVETPPAEEKEQDAGDGRNRGKETEQEKLDLQSQNRIDSLQIDRIEAQITAAARAVIASIEPWDNHGEASTLSTRTNEHEDQDSQYTYGEGTELTYEGTESAYETEDEHREQGGEEDSSSHHDGDVDDDVFSTSDHSKRSSINSYSNPNSSDEAYGKELTSPAMGEEAGKPMSRIPSSSSFSPRDVTPVTPSRVMTRPPFRTPSSVRAMQMSSPTPSIFSSPRSAKRHLPAVSRIGTPTSNTPSKRTPTRFKKPEKPMVLLHVTVLPLTWTYSHVISSPELPPELLSIKDNWRLLQHKLAETVLERGILLAHPQDSYEVLEERLLEALELPFRPRASILKCGHYMGPETLSSDDESGDEYFQTEEQRKWCDICRREVRFEPGFDLTGGKRFQIKFYASNGLMSAGSWAAVWRDMERIDVELQPYVNSDLTLELEHMVANASHVSAAKHEDDGFVDVDEEEVVDTKHAEKELQAQEEEIRRQIMEEERMREVYGQEKQSPPEIPQPRSRSRSRKPGHDDSLSELMLAAFKVAMNDQRNVVIFVMSGLILLLALWPTRTILVDRPVPGNYGIAHEAEAVKMEKHVEVKIADPQVQVRAEVSDAAKDVQNAGSVIKVVRTEPVQPNIDYQMTSDDESMLRPTLEAPTAEPKPKDVGPSDLRRNAIPV